MKGFMRMLEAVLAILMLLGGVAAMLRFIPLEDWSGASLTFHSFSILSSFAKSGLVSLVSEATLDSYREVYRQISSINPGIGAVIYIRGIPKPITTIATDLAWAEETLASETVLPFAGINHSMSLLQEDVQALVSSRQVSSYDAVVSTNPGDSDVLLSYAKAGGVVVGIGNSPFASFFSASFFGPALLPLQSSDYQQMRFSEMFKHSPGMSKMFYNSSSLLFEGYLHLSGNAYKYSLQFTGRYCVNFSGTCLYEGDEGIVGGEVIRVERIIPPNYTFFSIRSSGHLFRFDQTFSISNGTCLVGSSSRCGAAFLEMGNGGLVLLAEANYSQTDLSALLRAAIIHGRKGIPIHPDVFGNPGVGKDYVDEGSSKLRRASIVMFFQDYPAIADLYVWPLY